MNGGVGIFKVASGVGVMDWRCILGLAVDTGLHDLGTRIHLAKSACETIVMMTTHIPFQSMIMVVDQTHIDSDDCELTVITNWIICIPGILKSELMLLPVLQCGYLGEHALHLEHEDTRTNLAWAAMDKCNVVHCEHSACD